MAPKHIFNRSIAVGLVIGAFVAAAAAAAAAMLIAASGQYAIALPRHGRDDHLDARLRELVKNKPCVEVEFVPVFEEGSPGLDILIANGWALPMMVTFERTDCCPQHASVRLAWPRVTAEHKIHPCHCEGDRRGNIVITATPDDPLNECIQTITRPLLP